MPTLVCFPDAPASCVPWYVFSQVRILRLNQLLWDCVETKWPVLISEDTLLVTVQYHAVQFHTAPTLSQTAEITYRGIKGLNKARCGGAFL